MHFLAELNDSRNLGKGPEPMKVPYANKWQKETDKLRQIALDCDLTEDLKWGKPCFTFQKKNIAIIIPLKESCALSFFKGALLKDPGHVLQRFLPFKRAHEAHYGFLALTANDEINRGLMFHNLGPVIGREHAAVNEPGLRQRVPQSSHEPHCAGMP